MQIIGQRRPISAPEARCLPWVKFGLTAIAVGVLQACGGGGGADPEESASATAAAGAPKPSTSTSTAQAVWATFDNEVVLSQGETEKRLYSFQKQEFCQDSAAMIAPTAPVNGACVSPTGSVVLGAVSYYNPVPTWEGVWSCAGSPCTTAPTKPPEPAAPSLATLIGAAECDLWNGNPLPNLTTTVKGATVKQGGNWTLTWTATFTPTSETVAARSGFGYKLLSEDSGAGVPVDFSGYFFGESAKKGSKDPGPKFSFSMKAPDGSVRVTNVWVNGQAVGAENLALEENVRVNGVNSVDFPVAITPWWINGVETLLRLSSLGNIIQASSVLNGDWFTGNNDGGADGSALARVKVTVPNLSVSGEGSEYTVTVPVSADVKEISMDGTVLVNVKNVSGSGTIRVLGQPNSCKNK
jgi:hypothetical protein